jgi:hypothetical protein
MKYLKFQMKKSILLFQVSIIIVSHSLFSQVKIDSTLINEIEDAKKYDDFLEQRIKDYFYKCIDIGFVKKVNIDGINQQIDCWSFYTAFELCCNSKYSITGHEALMKILDFYSNQGKYIILLSGYVRFKEPIMETISDIEKNTCTFYVPTIYSCMQEECTTNALKFAKEYLEKIK